MQNLKSKLLNRDRFAPLRQIPESIHDKPPNSVEFVITEFATEMRIEHLNGSKRFDCVLPIRNFFYL